MRTIAPKQIIGEEELSLMDDDDIAIRLRRMTDDELLADAWFRIAHVRELLKKSTQ